MKKQRFLFTLLMAIVMMAFSPQTLWAQEEDGGDPGNEVPDDGPQECQHETLVYEHYESNVHQELCYTCGHCLQEEECSFVNGKCTKCNYKCGHDEWDNSRCTVCGIECNHSCNSNGNCTICGADCETVSVTIGGNTESYSSFTAAMNAACGAGEPATVTMLQDIVNISAYKFQEGTVTLDLNSHGLGFNNNLYGLNIRGGSLTITDNSDGKLGQVTNVDNYTLSNNGGSLTIHAGTFYAVNFVLFVSNGDVSIDGGRFISTNGRPIHTSSLDILAPGYGFFDSTTGDKITNIVVNELFSDKDVTVKHAHVWENSVCCFCHKVCEHSFNSWGVCRECGFRCTHEVMAPIEGDPASGHVCPVCQNTYEHNCIDGICTHCGYECTQHQWSNETGRCRICRIECDHNCDNDGLCSICGATCENVIVTIGGVSKRHFDFEAAKDAAVNAGEPATITLLQDVQTTVTFCSGNVTLDLNGYTITSEYSSVIDVAGGSLTITDSSAGKTGKMVNADTAIYAYGGTINIQGGTFTSNNHTALYCFSSEFSREPLAVSIEGGRFITKNENMSAIYSEVGSLLAPGYGFYNTDTDARLTNFVDHQLMNENGNPAKDVTVKALSIDALDLADATTYDGKNAGRTVTDFTYTRNFSGTNWTTWYAPFDLELTDEICQKLAFSRINNVHQYDDDDNGVPDRTIIESFRLKAGVTLRANYPYLVKALNDADRNIELHLSNVTLAPAAENSIDCNSVDYIYTFTGTYTGKSNNSDAFGAPYSLFDDVADNNWYHFHNLEPQRHYMVIEPTNGGQAPRNIKVNLKVAGEEDATGIVTLYSDKDRMQDEVEIYDLMGRKLNSNSTQRGLRIQNGKVIFNK